MRAWLVRVWLLALIVTGAAAEDVSKVVEAPPGIEALAAELARRDGGVVDPAGGLSVAGKVRLDEAVAARARRGGKLWVLVAPREVELGGALRAVAGRLAPGESDIVVVAGPAGLRARVPALAQDPSMIDEAFSASRRELAADLGDGIVAFVGRLDELRARRARDVRRAVLGLAGVAALGVMILLIRVARFRVRRRAWDRADAASHAALVGKCQERLEKVGAGRRFDELYAELKELGALAPRDAAEGLERLSRKLDDELARGGDAR